MVARPVLRTPACAAVASVPTRPRSDRWESAGSSRDVLHRQSGREKTAPAPALLRIKHAIAVLVHPWHHVGRVETARPPSKGRSTAHRRAATERTAANRRTASNGPPPIGAAAKRPPPPNEGRSPRERSSPCERPSPRERSPSRDRSSPRDRSSFRRSSSRRSSPPRRSSCAASCDPPMSAIPRASKAKGRQPAICLFMSTDPYRTVTSAGNGS